MMRRTIFEAEHDMFRESARRFYQNEIGPHAAAWREQGCVDRSAFLKSGAQGYLLMWAPEQYGGQGISDYRYEQILIEENALHGETGFYGNLHSRVVGPYLGKYGTPELQARILPDAISGEKVLAVAMTEPAAGSDLAGIKTRAEEKGDHWIISGSKTYISNGLLADVVVVVARTNPQVPHQIGLFAVEAGMEGFRKGGKLAKLGLDAQDTAELFFDSVRVPKENVLGDPRLGFTYLTQALVEERLQLAVGSIAHAQSAFALTLTFVKERKAFGKAIGTFQTLRHRLARMRAELDALQTFVDQCVMLHNASQLTADIASTAKLLTTELEGRVIDDCLQMHGGAGYMEDYRISRMYRDARVTRIFGGTNEIMAEIIGRTLGLDDRKAG